MVTVRVMVLKRKTLVTPNPVSSVSDGKSHFLLILIYWKVG